MKKVLLTTSALTMLAGVASAGVGFGGFTYVGITQTGAAAAMVEHGTRLTFSASTETDGGVGVGTSARFTTVTSANPGTATLERVKTWVSVGGAKLTVGATNGAVRTAGRNLALFGFNDGGVGVAPGIGLPVDTANQVAGEHADNANPGNVLLSYTMGQIAVHASTTIAAAGATEIGLVYTGDSFSVGVGSSSTGVWLAKVSGSIGAAKIGVGATSTGASNIVVSTAVGAGTLAAGYQNNVGVGQVASWGIQYAQSLGGGVTASVAVANSVLGVQSVGAGIMFSF